MNTQNIVATVIAFALALAWLRLMDALAQRGLIAEQLSRKLIHIGTGPLFVLCWNLYTPAPEARWLAALVPLSITAQFALVGLGIMKDEAAVKAMSRSGDPREILRGPLYYGIVFVVATLVFWRESPVGVLALMLMCGGDGLADVVGRRWGKAKLPWSPGKSWAGSVAMLLGSFLFGFVFVMLFSALGRFGAPLDPARTAGAIALIAIVATLVESFPAHDIDNISIMLAAIATAWVLIGPLGLWAAPFWG